MVSEKVIMMKKNYKKLGILGGMGPEATAQLYLHIIKRCQNQHNAKYNSDFPHIIINSYPIPDGEMWKNFNEKIVADGLYENANLLEKYHVDFIVIPCISVHSFIDVIRDSVGIPVLSTIEETVKIVKQKKVKAISIFATHYSIQSKLFDSHLANSNVKLIKPTKEQQKEVDRIIVNIESGKRLKEDKEVLLDIISDLESKGVTGIILGCTEIPLLLEQKDGSICFFDTIDILAEATFSYMTSLSSPV
ncbi:MAG: amino acid racemase [Symploca sp. SIO2C1]|nr:amino acid racemase [Symploca sp. SIO2C1]